MDDRERALQGPRALKERGSPDWCWQTVDYFKSYMRQIDKEWERAQEVLEDLVKTCAWQVIPPGQPYGTIDKMLKAEVGLDEKTIWELIQKAELAAQGRPKKGDVITFFSGTRGTGKAYTVRRLRRDGHTDLADEVERGELSANKAAVRVGYQHRSMTIPADDAERAFQRLSGDKGMDREQLILLAELLKEHLLTKED